LRSMRSFAAIVCVVCLSLLARLGLAATNTPVPLLHSSPKAASEAAAADQSLVLIVFGAEWCGPCKLLKAKTLTSKEFLEQGGALHFVEVDIDSEKSLARDYDIQAVPTLVLQTADNKIVMRQTGFMQTAELLLWLREARERVKQGKWEGTVPGSKLAPFIAKASADQLDAKDLGQLIAMLGEPDPANRQAVSKLLLEQREQAVSQLIESVTNSYLGTRIAAAELLAKLAPDAPAADPWQTPGELAETLASLKKWWAQTGKLPAQNTVRKLDPAGAATVQSALETLRRGDPAGRTEAMSMLVSHGEEALPNIRDALKAAEKTGDQRSVGLLEDVRWAILIPETVDQRAGGVRSVLARGKGVERQSAASRLGRAGRPALSALAELIGDSDPLVIESAVRALSEIGGADAIPAMAVLLKAGDSNLRMTAAQALGHTKNPAAVKELLSVIDDPNEVVACTALSALEEINSERGYSSSKKSQPPEVSKALKTSLADPRWRVRSAAAEVTGKLEAKELIDDLKPLLEDQDGFVVKSALEALRKLGGTPEPEKLMAVARRHAGLRGQAVEMLVNWGGDEAVKAVTETYKSSTVDGRLEILRNLSGGTAQNQENSPWQSLLAVAAAEPDPRIRRAAADALIGQPHKVAAALVGPLLADGDREARSKATTVVLSIISGEKAYPSHGAHGGFSEWRFVPEFNASFSGARQAKTNPPSANPDQLSAWHSALSSSSDPLTAAAIYVTGNSNTDLPKLRAALEAADKAALAQLTKTPALAAILPRLPWPDSQSQSVIERFCSSPGAFLRMLAYVPKAAPGLREFVYEPARFKAAVEPASIEELTEGLPRLLTQNQYQWSLVSSSPQVDAIASALLDSTNPVWRAAAVYSLGSKPDKNTTSSFERAAGDSNSWVRAAAVLGLARTTKDRPTLETRLGPFLADPGKNVFEKAALALLEPETRMAAGLDYSYDHFEFDKIHVWGGSFGMSSDQRPLAALDAKPPFLEEVRKRLASAPNDELWLPALLLAQYGDFTGLDRFLQSPDSQDQKHNEFENVLPTMIALSRDAKYVPHLKTMVAAAKDESEYRRLLQAIKGMPGAEARELRLEINKRMRQSND
jgi:HEAT repeat protein/thiol-disulfide isomerase/thioredoxin